MRNDGRLVGLGHRPDALETFLVAHTDPLVLAQMFLPGRDHELLDEAPRLSAIAPHSPGDGPRAPATPARVVQRPE
jgi:hypothetical protein